MLVHATFVVNTVSEFKFVMWLHQFLAAVLPSTDHPLKISGPLLSFVCVYGCDFYFFVFTFFFFCFLKNDNCRCYIKLNAVSRI